MFIWAVKAVVKSEPLPTTYPQLNGQAVEAVDKEYTVKFLRIESSCWQL